MSKNRRTARPEAGYGQQSCADFVFSGHAGRYSVQMNIYGRAAKSKAKKEKKEYADLTPFLLRCHPMTSEPAAGPQRWVRQLAMGFQELCGCVAMAYSW